MEPLTASDVVTRALLCDARTDALRRWICGEQQHTEICDNWNTAITACSPEDVRGHILHLVRCKLQHLLDDGHSNHSLRQSTPSSLGFGTNKAAVGCSEHQGAESHASGGGRRQLFPPPLQSDAFPSLQSAKRPQAQVANSGVSGAASQPSLPANQPADSRCSASSTSAVPAAWQQQQRQQQQQLQQLQSSIAAEPTSTVLDCKSDAGALRLSSTGPVGVWGANSSSSNTANAWGAGRHAGQPGALCSGSMPLVPPPSSAMPATSAGLRQQGDGRQQAPFGRRVQPTSTSGIAVPPASSSSTGGVPATSDGNVLAVAATRPSAVAACRTSAMPQGEAVAPSNPPAPSTAWPAIPGGSQMQPIQQAHGTTGWGARSAAQTVAAVNPVAGVASASSTSGGHAGVRVGWAHVAAAATGTSSQELGTAPKGHSQPLLHQSGAVVKAAARRVTPTSTAWPAATSASLAHVPAASPSCSATASCGVSSAPGMGLPTTPPAASHQTDMGVHPTAPPVRTAVAAGDGRTPPSSAQSSVYSRIVRDGCRPAMAAAEATAPSSLERAVTDSSAGGTGGTVASLTPVSWSQRASGAMCSGAWPAVSPPSVTSMAAPAFQTRPQSPSHDLTPGSSSSMAPSVPPSSSTPCSWHVGGPSPQKAPRPPIAALFSAVKDDGHVTNQRDHDLAAPARISTTPVLLHVPRPVADCWEDEQPDDLVPVLRAASVVLPAPAPPTSAVALVTAQYMEPKVDTYAAKPMACSASQAEGAGPATSDLAAGLPQLNNRVILPAAAAAAAHASPATALVPSSVKDPLSAAPAPAPVPALSSTLTACPTPGQEPPRTNSGPGAGPRHGENMAADGGRELVVSVWSPRERRLAALHAAILEHGLVTCLQDEAIALVRLLTLPAAAAAVSGETEDVLQSDTAGTVAASVRLANSDSTGPCVESSTVASSSTASPSSEVDDRVWCGAVAVRYACAVLDGCPRLACGLGGKLAVLLLDRADVHKHSPKLAQALEAQLQSAQERRRCSSACQQDAVLGGLRGGTFIGLLEPPDPLSFTLQQSLSRTGAGGTPAGGGSITTALTASRGPAHQRRTAARERCRDALFAFVRQAGGGTLSGLLLDHDAVEAVVQALTRPSGPPALGAVVSALDQLRRLRVSARELMAHMHPDNLAAFAELFTSCVLQAAATGVALVEGAVGQLAQKITPSKFQQLNQRMQAPGGSSSMGHPGLRPARATSAVSSTATSAYHGVARAAPSLVGSSISHRPSSSQQKHSGMSGGGHQEELGGRDSPATMDACAETLRIVADFPHAQQPFALLLEFCDSARLNGAVCRAMAAQLGALMAGPASQRGARGLSDVALSSGTLALYLGYLTFAHQECVGASPADPTSAAPLGGNVAMPMPHSCPHPVDVSALLQAACQPQGGAPEGGGGTHVGSAGRPVGTLLVAVLPCLAQYLWFLPRDAQACASLYFRALVTRLSCLTSVAALQPSHAAFGTAASCARGVLDDVLARLAPHVRGTTAGKVSESEACSIAANLQSSSDVVNDRVLELCCPAVHDCRRVLERAAAAAAGSVAAAAAAAANAAATAATAPGVPVQRHLLDSASLATSNAARGHSETVGAAAVVALAAQTQGHSTGGTGTGTGGGMAAALSPPRATRLPARKIWAVSSRPAELSEAELSAVVREALAAGGAGGPSMQLAQALLAQYSSGEQRGARLRDVAQYVSQLLAANAFAFAVETAVPAALRSALHTLEASLRHDLATIPPEDRPTLLALVPPTERVSTLVPLAASRFSHLLASCANLALANAVELGLSSAVVAAKEQLLVAASRAMSGLLPSSIPPAAVAAAATVVSQSALAACAQQLVAEVPKLAHVRVTEAIEALCVRLTSRAEMAAAEAAWAMSLEEKRQHHHAMKAAPSAGCPSQPALQQAPPFLLADANADGTAVLAVHLPHSSAAPSELRKAGSSSSSIVMPQDDPLAAAAIAAHDAPLVSVAACSTISSAVVACQQPPLQHKYGTALPAEVGSIHELDLGLQGGVSAPVSDGVMSSQAPKPNPHLTLAEWHRVWVASGTTSSSGHASLDPQQAATSLTIALLACCAHMEGTSAGPGRPGSGSDAAHNEPGAQAGRVVSEVGTSSCGTARQSTLPIRRRSVIVVLRQVAEVAAGQLYTELQAGHVRSVALENVLLTLLDASGTTLSSASCSSSGSKTVATGPLSLDIDDTHRHRDAVHLSVQAPTQTSTSGHDEALSLVHLLLWTGVYLITQHANWRPSQHMWAAVPCTARSRRPGGTGGRGGGKAPVDTGGTTRVAVEAAPAAKLPVSLMRLSAHLTVCAGERGDYAMMNALREALQHLTFVGSKD